VGIGKGGSIGLGNAGNGISLASSTGGNDRRDGGRRRQRDLGQYRQRVSLSSASNT